MSTSIAAPKFAPVPSATSRLCYTRTILDGSSLGHDGPVEIRVVHEGDRYIIFAGNHEVLSKPTLALAVKHIEEEWV